MQHLRSFSFLVFALATVGCGIDDPCARLQQHLVECVDATVVMPAAACDAETAAQLVDVSCESLVAMMPSGKADVADWFSQLACRAGIVRFCAAPVCDAPPVITSAQSTCADAIGVEGCGACQYYACRDAAAGCGVHGYYTAFATKYCERFVLNLSPTLSPAGQLFLSSARDCLMIYDDQHLATETDCERIRRDALASHEACYLDNGFCALTLTDRLRILGAIDRGDLDFSTALRTELGCLR